MSHKLTEAAAFSEDDGMRSEYIRKLVQYTQPILNSSRNQRIPKTIVQFWDDLQKLPPDVNECMNSWGKLAPCDFKHLIFDDKEARNFISEHFDSQNLAAFDRCYHPAMRCDYFRLCYLYINGGFYIDADELYQGKALEHLFENNLLKLQPLCYEASSGLMMEPQRFINNKERSSDWIFYFNNNPIISPPKHPVIHLALKRATDLLVDSPTRLEIQSTTGPGNLSASVVNYFVSKVSGDPNEQLYIIPDWESFSISPWPLSYRNDARNWRIGAKADTPIPIEHDN